MRTVVAASAIFGVTVLVSPALSGQSKGAAKPLAMNGGNGKLYIGTYKGEVEVYDETTEKLVETIKLKTIPRSITPSPDRTRFYALDSRFEQIEVVDMATRKTVDTFKLTVGNEHVRAMTSKVFVKPVQSKRFTGFARHVF